MAYPKDKSLGKSRSAVCGDINLSLERGFCKGNILSLVLMGYSAYSAYTHWIDANRLDDYFKSSHLPENRDILNRVVGIQSAVENTAGAPAQAQPVGGDYIDLAVGQLSGTAPNPYTANNYLQQALDEIGKSKDPGFIDKADGIDGSLADVASKIRGTISDINANSDNVNYLKQIALTGSLNDTKSFASKILNEYNAEFDSVEPAAAYARFFSYVSGLFGIAVCSLFGYHRHEPNLLKNKGESQQAKGL